MTEAGPGHPPYQQLLLEHYRHPRNRRRLAAPTHRGAEANPLCGDQLSVECVVQDGVIADAAFDGRACSVSQASASLMTQAVCERPVVHALALAATFAARLKGEPAPETARPLEQLEALLEVARFPARITCALLPWKALVAALGRADA